MLLGKTSEPPERMQHSGHEQARDTFTQQCCWSFGFFLLQDSKVKVIQPELHVFKVFFFCSIYVQLEATVGHREKQRVCRSVRTSFTSVWFVKTAEPLQFSCDRKKNLTEQKPVWLQRKKGQNAMEKRPLAHITNYCSQHKLKGNRHEMQSLKQE